MWCGVTADQILSPYLIPQRLTGDIYGNVLQDELLAPLENDPVQTRLQIYY